MEKMMYQKESFMKQLKTIFENSESLVERENIGLNNDIQFYRKENSELIKHVFVLNHKKQPFLDVELKGKTQTRVLDIKPILNSDTDYIVTLIKIYPSMFGSTTMRNDVHVHCFKDIVIVIGAFSRLEPKFNLFSDMRLENDDSRFHNVKSVSLYEISNCCSLKKQLYNTITGSIVSEPYDYCGDFSQIGTDSYLAHFRVDVEPQQKKKIASLYGVVLINDEEIEVVQNRDEISSQLIRKFYQNEMEKAKPKMKVYKQEKYSMGNEN